MYCFAFSSEDPKQNHCKQVPTALEAGILKTDAIPRLGVYLHQISIYHLVIDTLQLDLQPILLLLAYVFHYDYILLKE